MGFDFDDFVEKIIAPAIALPLAIVATPVVIAKVTYETLTENNEKPDKLQKIAIIGPTRAGKSKLSEILSSNKIIINDSPGKEEFISTRWKEAIQDVDVCVYVFNLKNYAENIEYEDYTYQQIVLLHLDLVYDWIQHSNQSNQKFIVIGTHSDELENDSNADSILNEIKSKLKYRRKEGVSFKALSLTSIDDNTVSDLDKLINEAPNAKK